MSALKFYKELCVYPDIDIGAMLLECLLNVALSMSKIFGCLLFRRDLIDAYVVLNRSILNTNSLFLLISL